MIKISQIFSEFFRSEKMGGFILIFVTLLSLGLANSPWHMPYANFWAIQFEGHSIVHWINDGLMTLFFLLIGLELEREIYQGELSNLKKASLPIFAALGGMLLPAAIFLGLNWGSESQNGAGIPMATDIAFAIGILSLLGSRVPLSLKIFLTALAVIDDLGAILIIAVFYTDTVSWISLSLALGIFVLLLLFNRFKIQSLIPYIVGGVLMWYFMLHSGIHATITGVLLAFLIPIGKGDERSPSFNLQHLLHWPVAFIILPLFAMANTSFVIESPILNNLESTNSLGIVFGLVLGKPLGIFLFSFLAVSLGLSQKPSDISWKSVIGAGFLGGIGFTMSIFITLLAFDNPLLINQAKISVLLSSVLAGLFGFLWLKWALSKSKP